MLQEFKTFIQQNELCSPGDKILLAVSGGIDSVVMSDLFYRANLKFGMAHCNFHLRGAESDADEKFVEDLAHSYKVPFFSKRFDTVAFANQKGISVQMAARNLRYEWFNEILKEGNYDYVATAHHLDDQAETFFINLIRGTGISGLHGILPKRDKIIRPLMFTSREEIAKYAKKNNITWSEDKTNAGVKYLRNNIRHNVLSQIAKINPDFGNTLNQTISRLRETEEIYTKHMQTTAKYVFLHKDNESLISIEKLNLLPHTATYLFEFLKPYNFTVSQINDIFQSLASVSGKMFYSPTHTLLRDRYFLLIRKLKAENASHKTEYMLFAEEKNLDYPVKLRFYLSNDVGSLILKEKKTACLDFDKLKFPLILRKWQRGDRFIPFGSKGKKKISDFFIDNKFTQFEKENTWLLISNGEIAWVVGNRIDERFKIDINTTRAFVINSLLP